MAGIGHRKKLFVEAEKCYDYRKISFQSKTLASRHNRILLAVIAYADTHLDTEALVEAINKI